MTPALQPVPKQHPRTIHPTVACAIHRTLLSQGMSTHQRPWLEPVEKMIDHVYEQNRTCSQPVIGSFLLTVETNDRWPRYK